MRDGKVKDEFVVSEETTTNSKQAPPRMSRWDHLEMKWNEIQVGRQGSYSIKRLESLDQYCKTTSKTRVVLVCLLTPLPALGCALLLEALPLRPPSEGWAANWVFWLRLLLMELMLGFAGSSQVAAFVPGLNFTVAKRLIIAVGTSAAYVGTCLLAAIFIGFPVPLMMQFGAIPISIYTPLITTMVLGPVLVAKDSPFKKDSDIFHRFFFAHMTLIGIYPLYKVLYDHVPLEYQSIVVIILPLWKFAAKSFVVRSTRQLEDFIPEFVAFSVDFYGTLFVSVCMYSSGSLYLSGLFVAADVGQSLLEFRELHANAKALLELLQDRLTSHNQLPQKLSRRSSNSTNTELVSLIVAVTRNPRAYHIKSLRRARLWACLPHRITEDQVRQLQMLEASGVYDKRKTIPSRKTDNRHKLQSVSVAPAPTITAHSPVPDFLAVTEPTQSPFGSKLTEDLNTAARRAETSKKMALQGLQLLFHCEYMALVEYVECVVPLVFVTYELVLNRLPNAVYYPNEDSQWDVTSVANLVGFAMMEVASFMFFNAYLKSKFLFSPLYQLAFVLETQVCAVQVHLLVALIILLQYELVHLGADFTLEFEWLHTK